MTTTLEQPAQPVAGTTPGTRFRRIGGGLSLLASGTLVSISLAMIPYVNETPEEYLQSGLDHTGPILWAAVVLHYGYLLLLPAALTLIRLGRRTARRLSPVATVLAGLGAGLSGIVAIDYYDVALAQTLPMDQALAVYDQAAGFAQAGLIAAPSMIGLFLGTILAGVVAWRGRAVPLAPVVLNAVGWVLLIAFPGSSWIPTAATAVSALSLIWMGTIVLRMRDEAWDRL